MLVSLARTADGHPFTLNHLAHYIQALGVTSAVDDLQGGLEETTERFKVLAQDEPFATGIQRTAIHHDPAQGNFP